jgi:DNA-binding transcriptional regulator of glucitol operon
MELMKKLRTVIIVLFVVCLAVAFYLGWTDNGPAL